MQGDENLLTIDDLRPHQKRMLDFLIERKRCAWWAEPGTGKTAPALFAAARMLSRNPSAKVLIASYRGVVHSVYRREARKWKELQGLQFHCLWEASGQSAFAANAAGVYLANWERLQWIADAASPELAPFAMCIFDESSALKNRTSQRSKLAFALARLAQVVLTMDGTPRSGGIGELYAQLKITNSDWIADHATFVAEFCQETQDGKLRERPDAREHLTRRLAEVALVFKARDVVGLQPAQQVTRYVDLPVAVHDQIDELSDQLATLVETDEGLRPVSVRAAIAVVTKIQQLTGGRAYGPEGPTSVVAVHDRKLDALTRLVRELNGAPLLVAAEFRCEAEAICAAIEGAVVGSSENIADILPNWAAGDVPVLVANPKSLGHGVDGLQDGGRHVCFFSQTWSSAKRQQFVARLNRSGQTKPVVVFDIVAAGRTETDPETGQERERRSMDEIMLARVTNQLDDEAGMLRALVEATKPKFAPSHEETHA